MQLAAQEHPDAVVLDIGMPDLTGYEVARRLRQEAWGRDVLLVAMTQRVLAAFIEKTRNA